MPPELVQLDETRQRRPAGASPEAPQDGLGQDRKSDGQTGTPSFDAVSLKEAVHLYSAIRHVSPENSLEVGFCCGGSGLAMLKDNGKGGKHYVCDPFQSTYAKNAGIENVVRSKLSDSMMFKEQFPEEFIPSLPRLQFAFVDVSQLFDLSPMEFILIDKKLDYRWSDSVSPYLDALPS